MFKIDKKTGLVLEGGGMRGVFTCGVLDYLMDNKVSFPYAIGVSAGACNGLSYMSHQRGRGRYSNIDLLAKYKYIGIRPLTIKLYYKQLSKSSICFFLINFKMC